MKLRELLSELRVGMLNDRSDRTTGSSDYLWTDERLVSYINEAQRRFAVRSYVIRDASTAEVCRVTLETGVEEYALHESIIGVLSAKYDTDRRDLKRAGHSILNGVVAATDNWDFSEGGNLQPGRPIAFATDEQVVESDDSTVSAVSMRVYPTPSATENGKIIYLRVARKPLDELTTSNLSAEPEIPRDHHIEMLDWAAYLALRIADEDAGNPKLAQSYAQSFETHVQAARTMVMRKLFATKPWGFGRGGWSWGA